MLMEACGVFFALLIPNLFFSSSSCRAFLRIESLSHELYIHAPAIGTEDVLLLDLTAYMCWSQGITRIFTSNLC